MSLRKYDFKLTKVSFGKVAYRTFMIFVIGLALAWFGMLCGGLSRGEGFIDRAYAVLGEQTPDQSRAYRQPVINQT